MSFNDKAFHASGNTIALTASTASSASSRTAISVDGSSPQVMIANDSTSWAAVSFGSSTVEASLPTTTTPYAGYMAAPGINTFAHPGKATYVAAVVGAGATGTVYVTPGAGR